MLNSIFLNARVPPLTIFSETVQYRDILQQITRKLYLSKNIIHNDFMTMEVILAV